jgi:exosortase/archaeosortase family protein
MIKKIFENKALTNLILRFSIFAIILISEITILRLSIDFSEGWGKLLLFPYIYLSIIFFIVLLFVLIFKKLSELRPIKKIDYREFSLFFVVHLISLFSFYKINKHIIENLTAVSNHCIAYSALWWFLGFMIVISLLFAFFGTYCIFYFIKKFKKQTLLSILITIIASSQMRGGILRELSRAPWNYLYFIIIRLVHLLLSLFFDGAFYKYEKVAVGIPSISVMIGSSCSGIEGIGLFIVLFTILIFIEHKNINKKRVFILYPIGIFGAFIMNILRIFSIIVVGTFTSQEFAVGVFHSNIGWILFTTYFLIFVYLSYSWMKNN